MLSALVTAGCTGSSGPKAPKPVPVSGTVYVDGKPVAGVTVRFGSQWLQGEGKTNDQGKYELVQGASPGENIVTFVYTTPDSGLNPDEGIDLEQLEAAGGNLPGVKMPTQSPIPAAYADPSTSKIKFTVPEGGTDSADFRLSSKGP